MEVEDIGMDIDIAFTKEELHSLMVVLSVANHESMLDHNGQAALRRIEEALAWMEEDSDA